MAKSLKVSVGQCSSKGRKAVNQDFHGILVPQEPLLTTKGIAIALADGIGSSDVSHIAAECAVRGLLDDYYCTSAAWPVRRSVERVITASNAWLHSRTRQSQYPHDSDRGYVCTLSALVIKSNTAHIFHVGDTRIYRVLPDTLEQLTTDHRVRVSSDQSHLSRAVGFNPQIEIDFTVLPVEVGDIFLLASDGVYEHVDPAFVVHAINQRKDDLEGAARDIVDAAFNAGSTDNLTVQIVRVDDLPGPDVVDIEPHLPRVAQMAIPPILDARTSFDGYTVVRELHASSRSHIYLATDPDSHLPVVLKTPSIDLQSDPAYLDRFLLEEWVARRLNSAHVLKPCAQTRPRNYLYVATEYIDGQTLEQWMRDNPRPDLETVRGMVEQIARGLQAFHRLDMLHQDLRPANIMIDKTGTLKIIDFGATLVAGISDMAGINAQGGILGTAQYSAPEYFLGEMGSSQSDLFSLGVITYQLLCGRLPYGSKVAAARTRLAQRNLQYASVLAEDREIPSWIDGVLRKAVHVDPLKRYSELSEFIYDLRHPNTAFLSQARLPLVQRNPVAFWKSLSLILAAMLLWLVYVQYGRV